MPKQPRPPGPAVRILDGHHELALHGVTLREDSFDVTYSVVPPLSDGRDKGSPILLFIEATDDLGNEYTDSGGAYGVAPDGTHTKGTISGRPALTDESGMLHVRFTFLRGGVENSYDLALSLPASSQSSARSGP
ncbi:hypothetical protein ACFH04_13870 [Streptomyces noboritoensis]|uniref:Allene oxide cyclase barrel-like domain-containing protein n=1 Tax=Streptomyces noboritoensis TaxID=67337 RepID=A0ABV6TG66_9ACTN